MIHDDDLRTFYRTYYDGYDIPRYDEANPALTIRLRLALEAVTEARLRRELAALKPRRARVVTVQRREEAA